MKDRSPNKSAYESSYARGISRKRKRRVTLWSAQTFGLGIFLLIVLVVTLVFSISSCGVSHSSAKKVVKSLLKAYEEDKESMVKECYGQKKETQEALQAQINSMFSYIKAHDTKSIDIKDIDVLSTNGNTSFVYAIYGLEMENGQVYPCLSTYMVRKDGKEYYILAPGELTSSMQKTAASDFSKFMTTNTYKSFMKEYNTFIKKNPGFEDRIATKMGEVL